MVVGTTSECHAGSDERLRGHDRGPMTRTPRLVRGPGRPATAGTTSTGSTRPRGPESRCRATSTRNVPGRTSRRRRAGGSRPRPRTASRRCRTRHRRVRRRITRGARSGAVRRAWCRPENVPGVDEQPCRGMICRTDDLGYAVATSRAIGRTLGGGGQAFCGKPSSMPPCEGSSQRLVIALPRVKKCTPSVPWAWLSPNSDAFQPPKLK